MQIDILTIFPDNIRPVLLVAFVGFVPLSLGCTSSRADANPGSAPALVDDQPPEDETVHPGGYDETTKSLGLAADIRAMWATGPRRSDGQPASTNDAINAASRVFNSVELVGKTGADVIALLGSPVDSSDSVYRSQPFWPIEARALVYRFDNGFCGWQFTVYCDGDDQPVTRVVREWIH